MRLITSLWVCILCLFSQTVLAASYDCLKAKGYVEKTICSEAALSTLDESLSQYYHSLLANFKAYPEDKGAKVLMLFQKTWLSYRNQCKTAQCLFDLYALQLSDLYNHHVSMDGSYHYYTNYDKGRWLTSVLASYGVKRGVSFTQAVALLEVVGWQLQYSEEGETTKDGIFCGSGWQAVCHASFKKHHKSFELLVMKPNASWLVDINNGGIYDE